MNGCSGARVIGPPGAVTDALRVATETARSRVQHRIGRASPTDPHATGRQIDKVFDLVLERVLHTSERPVARYSVPRPRRADRSSERVRDRARPLIVPSAHTALLIEIIDCVYTFGTQACDDPDLIIDIADALSEAWEDTLLDAVVEPQEDRAPAEVGLGSGLRIRVARILLLGEADCCDRRLEASVLGIDTDRDYVAFRARARPGYRREELAAELGPAGSEQPRNALAAEVNGDLIGFLPEPPTNVTRGVVGVGPAVPPDRLVESFELASRAMGTARAFGLMGVHTFGDLGLLPAIMADADIGEAVWRRYVQPIGDVEPGPETLTALRTYFACGMHVDRAAAELTLHPNTLRNRIARFEELADADLRDATVAMQVWWALQYATLADDDPGDGLSGTGCRGQPHGQPVDIGETA